jgi:mRNA interferase MazF
MPIRFHPKPAMVLICNFSTGFMPPEMVKRRRVVVVSPYQFNKRGICTVVPFSTSTPEHVEEFHYRIESGAYSFLSDEKDTWVKADMIATVSNQRLDRIRVGENFLSPSLGKADYMAVRQAIASYLDFQVKIT